MNLKINYNDISGRVKKKKYYLMRKLELKMIDGLILLIPPFVETYHLTLITIPLSALMILFSFLARKNLNWLWGNSLIIIIQYIADALDGEIGRRRKTGLIKWGFYADHFLDFVFAASVVGGYLIIFPQDFPILFLSLFSIAGFFVHELLVAVGKGTYNVAGYYGLGAPQVWMMLIALNIFIVAFNPSSITTIFIIIFLVFFTTLTIESYKTQKQLWRLDMGNKKKS